MTTRTRLGMFTTTGLVTAIVLMLILGDKAPTIQAQQAAAPHGQTATKLADGRWLLLGGESTEGTAAIVDPRVNSSVPLAAGWVPRNGHTATLLASGQVLVVGGRTPSGQLIAGADLVDPETGTILHLATDGGVPRASHTTTLLTDGRVIVTGGTTDDQRSTADLEIWDVQATGIATVTVAPSRLSNPRSAHTATLLSDGRVLLSGGVDSAGNTVQRAEIYSPLGGQVIEETPATPDPSPTHVTATIPNNGAQSVPSDVRLALRFSKPLRTDTVSANTVTLTGPDGPVQIAIVPAESGRLLFVSPRVPLTFDTRYTLRIVGAADDAGVPLVTTPVTFVTAEEPPTDANSLVVVGEEAWIPDAQSAANGWRSQRPDSPWRTLKALEAPPGTTALAGQVLRLDGRPLADVTLEIEGRTARTNGTGRFLLLLDGVTTGEQELVIDARTASRANRTYGLFEARVHVTAGVTTALPFTIWSPQLDTANQVTIPVPMATETVVTTPLIPGLELHLPAGTVIRDHEGEVARTITITPIPVDRPPFPMPSDAEFPVFFTIQPGGAYIHSYGAVKGAWLVYPNARGAREGKRVQFFNYDPDDKGWYVYGMGTVTGNKVIPDAKTRIYKFTGASFNDGNTPPPAGPTPGDDCGKCADPVSLTTGIFTFDETDLYLPDVLPIALTRSYNSRDPEVRPFGRGMTHPFAIFQHSELQFEEADLYLPDGGKIHYVKHPDSGGQWFTTIFEHTATPTAFYKSTIKFVGAVWHLTLKDGTVYIFGHAAPLQAIRDRHGNQITLTWSETNFFGAGTGNITRITSPNGRWIELTYYAGTNRIYQAKDNIGRTVTYVYDVNGNLTSVTDPMNHVTSYTYDASNRMTGIRPPNLQGTQLNLVTNEYTTAVDAPTPVGWVKKQTHADGGVYQFAYTVANGKSTQTDVTDPLGHVRRVTFNSDGYSLEDRRAFGEPEEQRTNAVRQPGGNFITSSTDALDRQTTKIYDDIGNLRSVTRLAGTPGALTSTYTYEPQFNRIATITDALERTTTFSYDSAGNLISITDPLNHATTMTYNGAGQQTSITDALQHSVTLTYQGGDVTEVTNSLGFKTTRFMDAIGRLVSATDPLSNRTRYEYDAANRLTRVIDSLGGTTTFAYGPEAQLETLTDARNNTTSYAYDSMGRLASRTDPLQGTEIFTYDLAGNPLERVDRKGQVTTRSYDALSRLVQVLHADGSTLAYTYDDSNRLTTIVDSSSGSVTRTYDDLDRLTLESTPQGSVSYTYDAADRRATMTVAGQASVAYGYDDANRLTSVTQGSTIVDLTYDDANRRSTLTLPNGILLSYGYDEASQLTDLTYTRGAAILGTLSYTYDAAGRRTNVGGTWARTALPQANNVATYDAVNQLVQWDGTSFSYDANGNLMSDGVRTYTWNARNELASLMGPVNASFGYDGFGRRRAKTIGGTTTQFLYDGLNPVQELSGGTPTANLLTGLGIDEYLTRTDTSGVRSYLTDALGSSLALADGSGAIQTEYSYEPFGSTTTSGGSTSNALAFTGRESDETGLYFYRARYYDPGLQRFISEDPLAERAGINFYSYVGNRPTLYIDPTGLAELCCRPVNMPVLRQLGAQHCFIKLSDGTTFGGYNRFWKLRPEPNAADDQCPKDTPNCTPLAGNETDIRRAWDSLPKDDRIYGLDGTSNRIPADVLDRAGIPYTMPLGAMGTGPIPTVIVLPLYTYPKR